MKRLQFLIVSILSVAIFGSNLKTHNKLLVVSLDGFRADYLTKLNLIHLKTLMQQGVNPKFVKTTFLTKTFPTHISIVTGLNEESHGIISNTMWDKKTDKFFSLKGNSSQDKFWFQSAYPVWMTAEDNNIKSGIYFWPGSEVSYNNKRPTKYTIFNANANFIDMINNVTHWLINEDIDLALMYFKEPDMTSHHFGPFANETIRQVHQMDAYIGRIISIFDQSKIKDKINYIFLSDHGMSEQTIFVNYTLSNDIKELIKKRTDRSPLLGIFAKRNSTVLLYRKLVEFFQEYGSVKVYLKENFPRHYYYSNNERIPDILILGDRNVVLSEVKDETKYWLNNQKGDHGYDNNDDNMNSFLVAKGPDIIRSSGVSSQPINQTDIYHLICALLKVKPRPNNGTLKAVKMFLIKSAFDDYEKILNSGTSLSKFIKVHFVVAALFLFFVIN